MPAKSDISAAWISVLTWFGWNHLIVCIGLTIVLTSGLINIINIHIAPVACCEGVITSKDQISWLYLGLIGPKIKGVVKIFGENYTIYLPCFEATLSTLHTNVSSCGDSNGLILRTVVHKDDIWKVSDLKCRKQNQTCAERWIFASRLVSLDK